MKNLALTLIMLLSLTGCGLMYDSDVCPVSDDSSVSLSFSMVSNGALLLSRTDSQNHDEVNSEFRYFEDGIDMSDLAVFIFAKKSGTSDAEKLVYKLTDLTKSDVARINIVGSPGNYLVEVMIFKKDLKDVLGFEITPSGNENISFRMLMLANCMSPGTSGAAKWNQITGTDYRTVISQLAEWNFAMSYIYNSEGGNDITALYKNKKEHVPMFGNVQFAPVSEDALYYSRPENRVYLGEMSLLRALAKVRVVDNIQNKKKDSVYPKITSVEFLSSQDLAHQLPYDAEHYENGQQVHAPNISQPDNSLNFENPKTYRLGILPQAWTIIKPADRKGDVFAGFVPEQRNDADVHPILRITIDDIDFTGKPVTYIRDVPMTSYEGTDFKFGDAILRNHIYTLSVNNFGATLDLTVDLEPYSSCVLEPFFGIERD